MWPFQRFAVIFRQGPLLPAVPLDGTQTVTGLRELERQTRLQSLQEDSAHMRPAALGAGGNRRSGRYSGPRLAEQPLAALRLPPRDWERFLLHGGQLEGTYNVPESLEMLQDRLNENLVYFLGNYLQVPLAVILLMGYLRPKAMVGVFILLATGFLNMKIAQASTSPVPDSLQAIQAFSWVAAFLAAVWSRCLVVIARSLILGTTVVLLHASLRRAQSDFRRAAPPGISISQFLSFRPTGGHPDPHRLARELWRVVSNYASYSAWAASMWVQQQAAQLQQLVQHLAQQLWLRRAQGPPEAYVR